MTIKKDAAFIAVMTQGVNDLMLPKQLLMKMIQTAEKRWIESGGTEYMTVFCPVGINIEISDGNQNVFERWINDLHLENKVWVMVDDYGEYCVCTLLLPDEY
jgi:hypothetical protein